MKHFSFQPRGLSGHDRQSNVDDILISVNLTKSGEHAQGYKPCILKTFVNNVHKTAQYHTLVFKIWAKPLEWEWSWFENPVLHSVGKPIFEFKWRGTDYSLCYIICSQIHVSRLVTPNIQRPPKMWHVNIPEKSKISILISGTYFNFNFPGPF